MVWSISTPTDNLYVHIFPLSIISLCTASITLFRSSCAHYSQWANYYKRKKNSHSSLHSENVLFAMVRKYVVDHFKFAHKTEMLHKSNHYEFIFYHLLMQKKLYRFGLMKIYFPVASLRRLRRIHTFSIESLTNVYAAEKNASSTRIVVSAKW